MVRVGSTNRKRKNAEGAAITTASTPVRASASLVVDNIVWKLRIRKMSAVDVLVINGLR